MSDEKRSRRRESAREKGNPNGHSDGREDGESTESLTRRSLLSGAASASFGLLALRANAETASATASSETATSGAFAPNLEVEEFRVTDAMVEPGGTFEVEFDLVNEEPTRQSVYAMIYGYPDRESFSRYDIDPTDGDATWGAWLTVEANESRHFEYEPAVGLDWPEGAWEAELVVREDDEDRLLDTVAQRRFGFAVGTDYSYECKRAVQQFEGAVNSKYQSGYYFANARDDVAESCDFGDE